MKNFIKELIPYVVIVILVVIIRSYIITPVVVVGSSMENTLYEDEVLLLSKISYRIGEIKRYLRDNSILRVTRTLKDIAYKALSIKENYMYKTGEEPTIEYIAEVLEVEKEEIVFALESMQDIVSIYENAYSDSESDNVCIIDQIKDTKNLEERWNSNLAIKEGMSKLNDRERTIIEKRFFQGKTQTEVAEEIGISQAQVSRLEKNALKVMKNYLI